MSPTPQHKTVYPTRSFSRDGQRVSPRPQQKASSALLAISLILPLFSTYSVYCYQRSLFPLYYYLIGSLLSFLLYANDKLRARHGLWRLRENLLHVVDLLGGWPGGYLAQQCFQHKTRKTSFQLEFWIIVAFHNLVLLEVLSGGAVTSIAAREAGIVKRVSGF